MADSVASWHIGPDPRDREEMTHNFSRFVRAVRPRQRYRVLGGPLLVIRFRCPIDI
jgi:hypothetical protein